MNTVRMFVFAIAFLTTALLLRMIADYFSHEQPILAVAVHGTNAPAGGQPASGSGS